MFKTITGIVLVVVLVLLFYSLPQDVVVILQAIFAGFFLGRLSNFIIRLTFKE